MQAHRAETTVAEDGSVTLQNVPFAHGEAVEVIVFPQRANAENAAVDPNAWRELLGLPLTYLQPFEPAAPEEDWEALR